MWSRLNCLYHLSLREIYFIPEMFVHFVHKWIINGILQLIYWKVLSEAEFWNSNSFFEMKGLFENQKGNFDNGIDTGIY